MKTKEIVINNIFDVNKFSLDSKNLPNSICYLDTSSIIRNIINKKQYLNKDKKNYPSRAKRILKKIQFFILQLDLIWSILDL